MAAPKITIYTDGAARGNPGPGGYGIVLISGESEKKFPVDLTTPPITEWNCSR